MAAMVQDFKRRGAGAVFELLAFLHGDKPMEDYPLLQGKRVLLVDDEADVLDSLEELLSMCEICKADNFEAARDYLQTQYFDLAVLDIMGVKGYEVLEIALNRNVTAVMLTAHAMQPDDIVKSFTKGAASFLPKEQMVSIASFLNDVLEAKEHGQNPWTRWYKRLASFFEAKFGPELQGMAKKRKGILDEREFWEKFPFH
jgi:CheY-like chemotaxis protein